MGMLEALPSVVRGGLVKAAKRCGAGVLADAAGAGAYPSQRCLFGNKRADTGAAGFGFCYWRVASVTAGLDHHESATDTQPRCTNNHHCLP